MVLAQGGHLHVLQWARANGWFYRLAIKFFTKHNFVKNSWDKKPVFLLLDVVICNGCPSEDGVLVTAFSCLSRNKPD